MSSKTEAALLSFHYESNLQKVTYETTNYDASKVSSLIEKIIPYHLVELTSRLTTIQLKAEPLLFNANNVASVFNAFKTLMDEKNLKTAYQKNFSKLPPDDWIAIDAGQQRLDQITQKISASENHLRELQQQTGIEVLYRS